VSKSADDGFRSAQPILRARARHRLKCNFSKITAFSAKLQVSFRTAASAYGTIAPVQVALSLATEEHMKGHTMIMLTGATVLGLAAATLPQLAFAQNGPPIGTWKLNLQRSQYIAGPAPRSSTLNIAQDGQIVRDTVQFVDAAGNVTTRVVMHVYDGQPHPATGFPDFDATVLTQVDRNTLIFNRLKAGKLVQLGTFVISDDGKSLTITNTGIDLNEQPVRSIAVYDKQ
jgi:hypothetical protein